MTTSASMRLAARSTTWQRPISAQRAPRQFSRVDVTCGHSGCASPRSGTSARSPRLRGARPSARRARACGQRVPTRLRLPAELLEPVAAQIVRAALEQRDARRHADGAGDQRQVLVEELVLQRARAGGDEHALAREQRGHQIREGLAGAGARLDHERRTVFHRERDALAMASCERRGVKPAACAPADRGVRIPPSRLHMRPCGRGR